MQKEKKKNITDAKRKERKYYRLRKERKEILQMKKKKEY